MALAPCVDCGHQFSDAARACPSCGRPSDAATTARRNTTAAVAIPLILLGAVLLFWLLNKWIVSMS